MRCTKCGTESTTNGKFCAACGSALASHCPKCDAENAPSSAFCEDCGTALAVRAGPAVTSSPQSALTAPEIRVRPEQLDASTIDGERKTVTALSADIHGSTELIRELDPEEARALVYPMLRLMMDAVHRYDGYVAQSTGDGIFALFGAPTAHEDHPQRALHAALAMQQTIREHAAMHVVEGHPAIATRVGVSTGEVVVRTIETGGHTEYTPIGLTAHLAARLQTVAPPGSVAVSETIRRLCEGYFSFRGLGSTAIKGISQPVEVYEVTGVGRLSTHFELAAQRGLTKFVGRERELAELQRALELARGGQGQIVAAVAEAGTGKSRLVYEFKAALSGDCKVLEAYSVSHGKASAYQPVTDDPSARRGKVTARLTALDQALNDIPPYLFALLGIQDAPDPLAAENPAEQKFCNECAAPLKKRCVKCGYENAPTAKFCGDCAAALTSIESRSTTRTSSIPSVRIASEQTVAYSAAIEGERKTVTALFADIKGSMDLIEGLDPEEARAIVDPALKLMMDAVHHYGGYVAQSTGDGTFALFGAPVAREDHPQRALHSALRMQGEMRRYSAKLGAAGNLPLEAPSKHRRSGDPFDCDRRGPRGVHTDRPFDQSGSTHAGAGTDWLGRNDRRHTQTRRRLLHLQAARPHGGQGRK
jgi:class 3 adenylate cyclase